MRGAHRGDLLGLDEGQAIPAATDGRPVPDTGGVPIAERSPARPTVESIVARTPCGPSAFDGSLLREPPPGLG